MDRDPYVEDAIEQRRKKKYKPNYRCIIPNSAYVPSNCPDFFLPYKDPGCDFHCPNCGTPTIMPLY